MATQPPLSRVRVTVSGLVQGVGFRPHVWRLAQRHGLTGHAANNAEGVVIEVQGSPRAVSRFAETLRRAPPPAARIGSLREDAIAPKADEPDFTILASTGAGAAKGAIGADTAPCTACLNELFDPTDRRFLHPFITCTDCGPRYTITRRLPYDRATTSMADHPLCPECAAEYADPASRRFHAEPIACPKCGPRLSASVAEAMAVVTAGGIVALKGVGGFQLICDARSADAVARLRGAKQRDARPFAIMVANAESAAAIVALSPAEAERLAAPDRPILIASRRADPLAQGVAPGLDTLGVMLPASPLHYLLFHHAAGAPAGTGWLGRPQELALVCTSANRGGEPLLIDGAAARAELAQVADLVLDHDRDIVIRADDGLVRSVAGAPMVLRRGRGQTPLAIRLARPLPPVLALGGYLKASLCVTRGDEAFLSQHIGDLDDPATLDFHRATAAHLLHVLGVTPRAIACDLHPDFPSTRLAHELGLPVVPVQHHHAHALAVLAEHRVAEPALALLLDGYGIGDDGEAWGGEVLAVDGQHWRRRGSLAPLPQPGGDRAAREPWRMAAAVLHRLGQGETIAARFPDQPHAPALARLLAGGRVPVTSSCGRLFDAAAGLIGLCPVQRYEAEAAMQLEALAAGHGPVTPGRWRIAEDRLDLLPTLARLPDLPPAEAAALFHATLADGLAALVARAARGERHVALSGGCLANKLLTEALVAALRARGFAPLLPREAPPGDGGLALGQAVAAALTLEEEG